MDYDRVLTLDSGAVVAIDTPANLWKDKGSVFRQMAIESGLEAKAESMYS